MKDVAIIGGTYNPPTKAHEGISGACLEQPGIDEVWLMPSGSRPDKAHMMHAAARLAMLNLVKETTFNNDERLIVTDFELRLPQPTQTYRTHRILTQTHPDHQFWYVFGADSYESMPSWQNGLELRRSISMLLVARKGYELPDESANIRHLPATNAFLGISSSKAREACRTGEDVEAFTSRAIANYIEKNGLYGRSIKTDKVEMI